MKDVGKIFENKLNDGKKEPSKSVWEKINTSLDTEKSRKKKILYTWFVGTGLVSLFLLFLVFNNEGLLQSNSPSQQDNIPLNNHSNISKERSNENPREENDSKELFKFSKEDTSIVTNEIEEKPSQFTFLNYDSELNEKEKSSNMKSKIQLNDSGKQSKNNKATGNTFDENSTVTKNYYYYNSRNNKTIVTKNKDKIDSLISEQHKPLDSVTITKSDSLGQ